MKEQPGTAVAVLSNGRHVSLSGFYGNFAEFRAAVTKAVEECWLDVVDFFYAYGREVQRYTITEFRSTFGSNK